MTRFFVKNESELFVSDIISNADIRWTCNRIWALSFRTRFAAEMFIRFLATVTDSKMSIVEVEK